MVFGNDEFNVCPAGKEADTFHERILDGLLDSFAELEDRYREIQKLDPKQHDQDDKLFISLFEKARNGLERIKNPQLPYDHKYKLAQAIREHLTHMELL